MGKQEELDKEYRTKQAMDLGSYMDNGKSHADMEKEAIRDALADYIRSEGCSCCQDTEKHQEAAKRLAELLNVEPYKDGSGYNFYKYGKGRNESLACDECGGTGRWKENELDIEIDCPKCKGKKIMINETSYMGLNPITGETKIITNEKPQ